MRVVHGESVGSEHLEGDAGVGSAGDLDGAEVVLDSELIGKSLFESGFACSSAGEEGAVDVEEDERGFVHRVESWRTVTPSTGVPVAFEEKTRAPCALN